MFADLDSLQKFYQTPCGDTAQRLLNLHVARIWGNLKGDAVLTLGYSAPLLQGLSRRTSSLFAFAPFGQGAVSWPLSGPNRVALIDPCHLPLPDQSIDRVLMLHMLEGAADPESVLAETWRVMKGNGKLLMVVPNRMGIWAHSEETPFGTGHPYSAGQIRSLLQKQQFSVDCTACALYMPPCSSRLGLSLAAPIEKVAARLFPAFGGVLIVEASKQLLAPTLVKKQTQRLGFSVSLPQAPLLPT